MAKENVIHVMEYCLAIKRKEILPFVTTWMSLEGIILSKISETEKKKNTVRLHLYEKSKKKKKKLNSGEQVLQGQASGMGG